MPLENIVQTVFYYFNRVKNDTTYSFNYYITENDIDVIGLARNEFEVCIEVFFVRKSKMIGREHFFFKNLEDEKDERILSEFVKQYYLGREIEK